MSIVFLVVLFLLGRVWNTIVRIRPLRVDRFSNATLTVEFFFFLANHLVPNVYPVDLFEHIWMVDRVERLGISRYFKAEIKECIDYVNRYIKSTPTTIFEQVKRNLRNSIYDT